MKAKDCRSDFPFFPEIRGKLGFGMMRLPMIGEAVDLPQTKKMIDAFLVNGFHYFDTAHGYISGKSEVAVWQALTERYPRELTKDAGKASDCIGCGQCSDVCPQHLDIPALLSRATEAFE